MFLFWGILPGKSHGQRSLVGCNPWGPKELDTAEQFHFHFTIYILELPWWLSGKESACSAGDAGDAGSIPGSG